jgi:hypothetical protein
MSASHQATQSIVVAVANCKSSQTLLLLFLFSQVIGNVLPSPKGANRLPDRRNNSVCPQNSAGLKAADSGGSSGSCAEHRAEDVGRHCRNCVGAYIDCRMSSLGELTLKVTAVVVW